MSWFKTCAHILWFQFQKMVPNPPAPWAGLCDPILWKIVRQK